jgi:hypothetical protein
MNKAMVKWIARGQMVLSIWLVAAPWILGYADVSTALWANISSGTLIFIGSLWLLFGDKRNTTI